MKLLLELLMMEKMYKKFRIYFSEDDFTVRYAASEEEALSTLSDKDKDRVSKVAVFT